MSKEVFIKKLILKNFKKVQDLTVTFTDKETFICGSNGTCKTTIVDAFYWLLFGKDSTNRSDSNFNIKTLGKDGKPILRLVHSVTGVLSVNGREIELQRNYVEKWGSGVNSDTLQNHATEFYLNGVKLKTKKEYDAEVASIIPEDVFRMITNPFFFPSMKAADQKAMLMDMAGNVSDEEVAALKPEFLELMSNITGRSLEQFGKEIAAKKSAIKDELKGIPLRIDSVLDAMPEAEDWVALDAEITSKKKKLADIDNQIADKSKQIEAVFDKKMEIQNSINAKKLKRTERENEIKQSINSSRNEIQTRISNLSYQVKSKADEIERRNNEANYMQSEIEQLDKDMDVLRGMYHNINEEQLKYPDGAFVCPTCKRPLDVEDIQAKQEELQAQFNQEKANRLKGIQTKGKQMAAKQEELVKKRSVALADVDTLKQQKAILEQQVNELNENLPEQQNAQNAISSDKTWISLCNEIEDLENQLKIEAKPIDTTELKEAKAILSDAIDELNKRLGKRSTIERSEKVISELENKRDQNNQALSELERIEFIAQDFQKAKDNKLIEKINGMFSLVSFSFISEKLNGNENITCMCTVDGVPFPDLNSALKINAGLDIINAICNSKGISAPIFIDNRESVNEIIPTISQIINLSVSKHDSLMIRVFSDGMMEQYQKL